MVEGRSDSWTFHHRPSLVRGGDWCWWERRTWTDAQLQEPRLRLALTRFRHAWRFDGREAVFASRAIDESGYVQPSRAELIAARGANSIYHYNGIKFWRVAANGTVTHVEA